MAERGRARGPDAVTARTAHLLEQRRRRGRRWRHSERWRWWRRLCLDDNVEGGRALAHAAFQLEKILPRCRVVRKRCLAWSGWGTRRVGRARRAAAAVAGTLRAPQ